ncbi:hypothetical protein VCR4J2_70043 [Vibrio coralliirubri]|nr:hypothetical protein VCR4J2_70043 [Vibrio coralliirubri]
MISLCGLDLFVTVTVDVLIVVISVILVITSLHIGVSFR